MGVMPAHPASVRLSVVADAGRLGRKNLSMSTTARAVRHIAEEK
jgi:hypothetical protein